MPPPPCLQEVTAAETRLGTCEEGLVLAAEREAAAQARLREARQEQEQVMRGVAEAHKELAGLRAEIQVGRACVCVCVCWGPG